MEDKPLVSIACAVYNHEPFIRQCLDGFIMQKTNFKFEAVVHDDASTDNSANIIREYEVRYPDIIKPIYQKKNYGLGSEHTGRMKRKAWRGKYLAFCEGDDYWTDALKLQKQVDYFEDNSEYVMSFHSVKVENQIKNLDYQYPIPSKSTLTVKNLAFKHYIPTCSLIFRKNAMPNPMPDWVGKCPASDIVLELLTASKGLTYYSDEIMAVYRKHENSITRQKSQILKGRKGYIFMYQNLRNDLDNKYWVVFTLLILKTKLGFIKDWVGLNPLLRSEN